MSAQWILAAATVAQSVGQLSQGKTQAAYGAAAADLERQQYEENAEIAKLQALDEEARRRRNLRMTEASNAASVAQSGYDPYRSPSFAAITANNERVAAQDIASIRLMGESTAGRNILAAGASELEGRAYRRAGRYAPLTAATTLLGGAYQINRLGGFGGS